MKDVYSVMVVTSRSSCDSHTFIHGIYKSRKNAVRGAIRYFVEEWVQGEWERYDPTILTAFKEAVNSDNMELALQLQTSFSDLKLCVFQHAIWSQKKIRIA